MLSCTLSCSWKAAAASYLDVGGQLLSQLQSEEGAVLTEQLLTEVAVAREALEKADAAYNTALDKLEVRSCRLLLCCMRRTLLMRLYMHDGRAPSSSTVMPLCRRFTGKQLLL